MQDSVSSIGVAKTTASTHFGYPLRDGQAELARVARYIPRWFAHLEMVIHPSTNRAQCRVTPLLKTNALLISQTTRYNDSYCNNKSWICTPTNVDFI